MERKDWTLLALAAAEGQTLTPVQLQKVLFLLGKKIPGAVGTEFYEFHAYNYGPFDSQVYVDAEELGRDSLVVISPVSGQRWSEFSISKLGLDRASEVAKQADEKAVEYLGRVVEWARKKSFAELVRAVYHEYPEFRKNSVFQG